ncbi:MAG: hypothetical protein SNJ52_01150 [Verrucomicrobiia bacterium]
MKHSILWSLLLASVAPVMTTTNSSAESEGTPLDLAQRRAIKQYQEGAFATHEAAIKTATKEDLTLLVDWEKIALPGEAQLYNEEAYWDQIFFQPLIVALQSVGSDDLGKEALREKLEKIHITYDEETAPLGNYINGVTFEGGTLTINFRPYSNAGGPESTDFKNRVQAIVETLEKGL